MALLFMEGFDYVGSSAAYINKKWDGGNCNSVATSGARTGAGAGKLSYNDFLGKSLPAGDVFVIGFAIRFPLSMGSYNDLVYWRENGAAVNHVTVSVDGSGYIVVKRDTTVLATSTSSLFMIGSWYYLEIKVVIHDTTGSVEVRVDTVPVAFSASLTNVDTRNGGTGNVNYVMLNGHFNDIWFDDLYVCDDSGSVNNNFLGICAVETLLPQTGAGTHQDFTPSTGTDHGAMVDEIPPDDDATYNASTTVGHQDSYNYPSLALTGTILGLQASIFPRKTDVGARTVAPIVRTGGTTTPGATVAPLTIYKYFPQMWESKPAGGAWTEAEINALEVGMKIVS